MSSITKEAEKLITGDRRKDYGSVEASFANDAKMWSGILGVDVSAKQVVMCMIAYKLRRESFSHKRDNLVDLVGYTLLLEKLHEKSKKRNN